MLAVQRLDTPDQATEKATVALIDGSITWTYGLQEQAEWAFTLPTPAGESPTFFVMRYDGVPYYYVHFHGVEFRSASANVQVGFSRTWYVLHALGVRDVISGAAAGSLHRDYRPGDIAIIDDFIDLSHHRPRSILTEIWERPPYIGATFAEPTCPELRAILISLANERYRRGRVHERAVLVEEEGHRFSTPAESRMMQRLGGDLVAHHQASEAIYARELGIHYAALDYITNIAEGLEPNTPWIAAEEVRAGGTVCVEIMLEAVARAARRTSTCTACPRSSDDPAGIAPESVLMKPVYR